MRGYLYIISALFFLFGIALVLYTDTCRNLLHPLLSKGKTTDRIISFFILTIGATLSFASLDTLNFSFILGLGSLIAITGLIFLINPKNIFGTVKKWYAETASHRALRFCGILMVIIGETIWFLT